MLAEFRRVLVPSGVLVISSPNRPVYNEAGEVENHFHVRELDRDELKALLDRGVPEQAWYGQRVMAHSAMWSAERFARRGALRHAQTRRSDATGCAGAADVLRRRLRGDGYPAPGAAVVVAVR